MCEPKSGGGGGNLLPSPLPGKWRGGERPLAPPVPTPMTLNNVASFGTLYSQSRNKVVRRTSALGKIRLERDRFQPPPLDSQGPCLKQWHMYQIG